MTGRSRLRWAGLIIGLLAIQAVGFAWIITHQATPAAPAQTADVASPDADHGAVEGAERL